MTAAEANGDLVDQTTTLVDHEESQPNIGYEILIEDLPPLPGDDLRERSHSVPDCAPQISTLDTPDFKMKISLSHEQICNNVLLIPAAPECGDAIKVSASESKLPAPKISATTTEAIMGRSTAREVTPKQRRPRFDYTAIEHKEARFKCKICNQIMVDPRVLACLHNFCMLCLMRNVDAEADTHYTDRSSGSETSIPSNDLTNPFESTAAPVVDRRTSTKSNTSEANVQRGRSRSFAVPVTRNPVCPLCHTITKLPIGGVSRLPKNTILERLIARHNGQSDTRTICSRCSNIASAYCSDCRRNLCATCSEAHVKNRTTFKHKLAKLLDERGSEPLTCASKRCPIHPSVDLKLFCVNCNQVACAECLIVIHRGHKCESIHKAAKGYRKLLADSMNRVRPMSTYATLTVSKLAGMNKKVDQKCDRVRREVEQFLWEYQEAVQVHRHTLLSQIEKAKQMKVASIETQTSDLEMRSAEAKTAIDFAEQLMEHGSEVELMSMVGAMLKRFEYCQKSKVPLDANVNDSLRFLPEVRAPSTSAQNNIPLFGIITTQTANPNLCTMETKGLQSLKVNKRVECIVIARDRDDKQLCHGGLDIQVELKYTDFSGRILDTQVSDKRDGSYVIGFTPDVAGVLRMAISISGKAIKDSPITMVVQNLKPHSGQYHCCTFCSSNASKLATCACGALMDGYSGCGHGHDGHPGRRHWSCCANVMENSECLTANGL